MPARDQWRASIRPRIEIARTSLRERRLDDLIHRSGAIRCASGLELPLFTTSLNVSLPEFEIRTIDGEICPEETQILLLDYLIYSQDAAMTIDLQSSSPSNRWIGFQELPDGSFYAKAFRSYSSDVLVSEMDGDLDRFRHACDRFGGHAFSLGDAAFSFQALPNIRLAVVWWAGDDEFPANANVLFDRAAARALPIDGMASLGRTLCYGLLGSDHDNE